MVNGAVQPALAQAGWPSFPQNTAPETQPPAWQEPLPPPQVAPEARQRLLLVSQHPPAPQVLPLQHAWPAAPHVVQLLPLQAVPDAVQ